MIAEMAKIQLAAPKEDRDSLLTWLQDQEVLHINHETDAVNAATASDTGYQLAQLQFTLEYIAALRHELNAVPKKNWRNLFVSKPVGSIAVLQKTLEELQVKEITTTAHSISQALTELKHTTYLLEQELRMYEPWQNLALEGTGHSPSIVHYLITCTSRHEEALLAGLKTIPTSVYQVVHRAARGKIEVIRMEIIAHRTDAPAVDDLFITANVEQVRLELPDGQSVTDRLKELHEKQAQLSLKHQQLLTEARPLLAKETQLKFAYDALLHLIEREQISTKIRTLPHTFIVTAWIPKNILPTWQQQLEKIFPATALETIAITEQDKAPVALMNNALVAPFETVTNLYGKPGYHELDPSAPLALFFLLSFALALTDAGYGLVLMAGTLAAEKFFRLKRDMKKMTRLLFLAGAMTVVLGALTGGWFGVTLETLPESALKQFLLSMKILDPISEPMKLLGVALGIGVVQLLFAWVVKAVYLWRTHQRVPAILDNLSWLFVVLSILAWVAAKAAVLPASWEQPALWFIWAGIALIVVTQGRAYKNPFLKVGGGVLSLFGLMSFVSDTLSYSRLLALGLATGIIGFVVNLLAGMAADQVPFVGTIVAVGILLVGHTFNLAINALGAFIHAGRLQFVEFFPKFLEGGGLPYKPFGRVGRYVDNPKEFT